MITRKTFCGRELYFSDCDADLLKNCRFTYGQRQQIYSAYDTTTKRRKTVFSLLFGCDLKTATIHIDGNRANFQRENLQRMEKSEWLRYRGPIGRQRYKGVAKETRRSGYTKPWRVEVSLSSHEWIRIFYDGTEEAAAGIYNAMCDFLDFPGFRNDVPKIDLTVEQKKLIYKKLKQYKAKGVI